LGRAVYLCYIDESGTSDVPGNSSHFVLAGLSVPIWRWRNADREISAILSRYGLGNAEIHTAWMLRPIREQAQIQNFQRMDYMARRSAVQRQRAADLLRLQSNRNLKPYYQAKKNHQHTQAYVHLTQAERLMVVQQVADCVAGWGFARLFAECIDKIHFDPLRTGRSVDEQAFEQVVSRFHHYLTNSEEEGQKNYGLLVHDNNQTIAKKHTDLMRHFHTQGTLWNSVDRIIETPLFVDSALTRIIQIADLCSYALRRYVEKRETDLFRRVFTRADRIGPTTVGVRHYSNQACQCDICIGHRT
jgi:hypothetical protein